MPRVRRQNVRPAHFQHLLDRVQSRRIPASQLELLAKWLDEAPEVPEGLLYKRFSGMTENHEMVVDSFHEARRILTDLGTCPRASPGGLSFVVHVYRVMT